MGSKPIEDLALTPCCGKRQFSNLEGNNGFEISGCVYVHAGVHQLHNPVAVEVFECLENVSTGERVDVPWLSFWKAVGDGKMKIVPEMEVLAWTSR